MIENIIGKFKLRKEKSNTHVAYTPAERASLEGECEDILKQEVFGRRDFEAFNTHMLQLTAKAGDLLPLRYAVLTDPEGEITALEVRPLHVVLRTDPEAEIHTALEVRPHDITVHSGSISTDNPRLRHERLNQRISYERQKERIGKQRDKIEDFRSILHTSVYGDIQHVPYLSYFRGEEETVVAMPQVLREKQVSDKDVQAFCAKVYNVYTRTKKNS